MFYADGMPHTPPDNSKLLVISFDDALRAQEFLLAVSGMQQRDELLLHDAVIIRREADGSSHVRETTDVTPTQAGAGAGFWGLLIGTLLGGPIGGLVVGVIYNGLELLGLSASARLMWTALVLLAAVIVDRVTRQGRTA